MRMSGMGSNGEAPRKPTFYKIIIIIATEDDKIIIIKRNVINNKIMLK
jgi:hypothetical protein